MYYKEIGVGLGRSVRLEPYNVIRPEARLVVELEKGDEPELILNQLKEEIVQILDELEVEEAERQGFIKVHGNYIKKEEVK